MFINAAVAPIASEMRVGAQQLVDEPGQAIGFADDDVRVLAQLGLDPDRLTYFFGGLDQKLVGVEGAEPIRQII